MSARNYSTLSDRHEKIARTFYEGIERVGPKEVSSRRMCPCLDYVNTCVHPLEGDASYLTYRGESFSSQR